jgi:hypothetical protein
MLAVVVSAAFVSSQCWFNFVSETGGLQRPAAHFTTQQQKSTAHALKCEGVLLAIWLFCRT